MTVTLAIGAHTMTLEPESLPIELARPFEDFYVREYPALHAVAATMANGMKAADDLVQDTMLRAFVHWSRVQRLESPGGWSHRVLINLCRNWYRRRQSEARFLARQRRVTPSTGGPSPDTVAFCEAVRRLPSRPRAVVALYFIGDRPVREIAAILDVPEGTVRSDLTRARVVLAEELGVGS
jgi:RNA polymerase sigma-70 factor (ECF subfamily)